MKKLCLVACVLMAVVFNAVAQKPITGPGNLKVPGQGPNRPPRTGGTRGVMSPTSHDKYEGYKKCTFFCKGEKIEFNLMCVPPSTFEMGCDKENENCGKDEARKHNVTISPFVIGETEVSLRLWHAVMGSCPEGQRLSKEKDAKDVPVYGVSWEECQEFISKLNEYFKYPKENSPRVFRLPTEAEWEYAARGATKSKKYTYSGSSKKEDNAHVSIGDVKRGKPNELGIYCMSSNVSEWCWDWYGEYSYTDVKNPTGARHGKKRVVRDMQTDDAKVFESVGVTQRASLEPDKSYADGGRKIGLRIVWGDPISSQGEIVSPQPQPQQEPPVVENKPEQPSQTEPPAVNKPKTDRHIDPTRITKPVEPEVNEPPSYEVFEEYVLCKYKNATFKMMLVEAGSFDIGCPDETGGLCTRNETPAHKVTLTDNYYIGETEVTQDLWIAVMGSNPSGFTSEPNLPVEYVSWNECQEFMARLNEIFNFNESGVGFRLPTEAEWEFAATGGLYHEGYKYIGSNNLDEVSWTNSNSGEKPHPVKTKAPNELGIYDMGGNLVEWCQDWAVTYTSDAVVNPKGPSMGRSRVVRGGSWLGGDYRPSWRIGGDPSTQGTNIGFRMVLVF